MVITILRRLCPQFILIVGQWLQIVHVVFVSVQVVLAVKAVFELVNLSGRGVVKAFLAKHGVASFRGNDVVGLVAVAC